MTAPSLADVRDARGRVHGVLLPTPLLKHPLLDAALGLDIYVKHENHLPTGAFKVRGGVNLVSHLVEQGETRPLLTATTGNHGQSIAFAAQRAGLGCTIVVPEGNNPEKNAAMRAFGAEVVEHGRDFDAAREEVERRLAAGGVRYVHSANEPWLIAGVGTYALEIFDTLPDADVVLVPIGGGSGASGLVTVRDGLGAHARIIGVQAAGADAFTRSWRTGTRVVGERVATFAEGLATRVTFDLTFDILRRGLDDIVTVDDEALGDAVRLALSATHNLAEGAGAATIAAAAAMRDGLRGQRVVCVMSGGNIDRATLARLVA